MDLDDSLRHLGLLGRYQVILVTHLFIFAKAFPAALTMMMVFITASPDLFYCTPPDGFYWNETVPVKSYNSSTTNQGAPAGCNMFEVHDGIVSTNLTSCLYGWDYSYQHDGTSIIADFDLVCNRALLKETATTTFMAGLLVGALPLGQIADIFGRKLTLFVSIFLLGATGTGLAFAYNYYAFVVLWFWVAVFRQGAMTCGNVLAIEMFPPERRALVGCITHTAWGTGTVVLSLLAYLLPKWRHLQLALPIGILTALPFWWIIHESVRWLLSQERYDEAERILHKMAKCNGVSAPETFLNMQETKAFVDSTKTDEANMAKDQSVVCKFDETDNRLQYAKMTEETKEHKVKKLTVFDLFRTPHLAKNTLILALDWIAAIICYYGLALNSVSFAGDKYLNFFLLSLVEIPAYIIAYFTMEHCGGRRLSVCLSSFFAGFACVIIAWLPDVTSMGFQLTKVFTFFAVIGKFSISYASSAITLYTSEVLPTGVRSVGSGLMASLSQVGGMLAPFILRLGDISRYLPMNIFGILCIAGGLLSFLLPETRSVPLPETIADGEKMR